MWLPFGDISPAFYSGSDPRIRWGHDLLECGPTLSQQVVVGEEASSVRDRSRKFSLT